MDQQTVENFFKETCTAEEVKQVVTWFATKEGQAYLEERLDGDITRLQEERIKYMLAELDSLQLWNEIEACIGSRNEHSFPILPAKRVASYWYAAAVIAIITMVSVSLTWRYTSMNDIAKNKQPRHFATNANQQKTFTLKDGTEIKLNGNSQLWISPEYGQKSREVTLKGEAYFEVEHNQAKPFVIHARGVMIKDLGTVFDVRAIPGEDNVQVTVKSGSVSIHSGQKPIAQSDTLTGGQFGYFDLKTDSISINEFAIKNYLSWINRRFKFDHASLKKVSEQLSHIYNVSFAYGSDSLKRIQFSADFKRGSFRRTLDVIALTLSIDYQIKNDHVIWQKKQKSE